MMDNATLAERMEMDLIGPNNQRRKQGGTRMGLDSGETPCTS